MVLFDEMMLHQMVNTMNHELEQLRGKRRQCSYKKAQDKNKIFLWDMLFTPSDESIVCILFSKH